MVEKPTDNPNIDVFNEDVSVNAGYRYSTNNSLSSQMANLRISDAILASISIEGKRVIDIGCGDGVYTIELYDRGRPSEILGCDPAEDAVQLARAKIGNRNITFEPYGAYSLPLPNDSFDIAHIRGVLHHLEHPIDALREAFRVAPMIVVMEPNGYNPILKVLERVSPYHVAHDEKSYTPPLLDRWVESVGGKTVTGNIIGLVPMFCPDWMARPLKVIEPVFEAIPVVKHVSCAQYIFAAQRQPK